MNNAEEGIEVLEDENEMIEQEEEKEEEEEQEETIKNEKLETILTDFSNRIERLVLMLEAEFNKNSLDTNNDNIVSSEEVYNALDIR